MHSVAFDVVGVSLLLRSYAASPDMQRLCTARNGGSKNGHGHVYSCFSAYQLYGRDSGELRLIGWPPRLCYQLMQEHDCSVPDVSTWSQVRVAGR